MIGRIFKDDAEKEKVMSELDSIYSKLDYYKANMEAGKILKRYCDICECELEKDDYYICRFDWADSARPDCGHIEICASCQKKIINSIDRLKEEIENHD